MAKVLHPSDLSGKAFWYDEISGLVQIDGSPEWYAIVRTKYPPKSSESKKLRAGKKGIR